VRDEVHQERPAKRLARPCMAAAWRPTESESAARRCRRPWGESWGNDAANGSEWQRMAAIRARRESASARLKACI
jgi:hypothetical protein